MTSFLAAAFKLLPWNKPQEKEKTYSVKEAIFWQPTGKVVCRGLTYQQAEDECVNLRSRHFPEIDYYISEEQI